MILSRGNLLLTLGLIAGTAMIAPLALAQAPGEAGLRVVQSGHSLTDPIIVPLEVFVRASGLPVGQIQRSTIPGSPMDWRWDHAPDPSMPDIRQPQEMARFDQLVITERAPLSGTVQWHDSPGLALRWAEHAWRHGDGGKGATSLLYATWVETDSGPDFANPWKDPEGHIPFRDRLLLEMRRWEVIRAHVNANRPEGMPAMRMIPGPLIMAAAYDAIAAGEAPGLDAIEDLFVDGIHVNALGAYLIALAHYAVIYDRDPRGLPANVPPRGGPDPAQAEWMQGLVHRVLSDYNAE